MSRSTWETYCCPFKTGRHLKRDLSCLLLIVVVHIVTIVSFLSKDTIKHHVIETYGGLEAGPEQTALPDVWNAVDLGQHGLDLDHCVRGSRSSWDSVD